jgi:hypothetical protein
MVCDRGKSYDAEELQSVSQQKCLAHLLGNAAEVTQGEKRAEPDSSVNG